MTRSNFFDRFWRDESGLAAEFALVLPLLLLLLLGTIDVGFYAYRINTAEKATQVGARWAAVTDPVAAELKTESYVNETIGTTDLGQGDRIPLADFSIICTSTGATCACTGNDCLQNSYTRDSAAFDRLAGRMQQIFPAIQDSNIQIEYSGSGLGFAGNPTGPDSSPLITIRLTGMSYSPIAFSPLGGTVDLPDFAYSITSEDLDCADPNVCDSN